MVPDEQDAAAQQDQKIPVKIKSEYVYTNTHTTLIQVHTFFFFLTKQKLALIYYKFKKNLQAKGSIILVLFCQILITAMSLSRIISYRSL